MLMKNDLVTVLLIVTIVTGNGKRNIREHTHTNVCSHCYCVTTLYRVTMF